VWGSPLNACTGKSSSFSLLFFTLMRFFRLVAVYCPAVNTTGTSWPQALATTTASGSCFSGYYYSGNPQRTCSLSGNTGIWGSPPNCTAVTCSLDTTTNPGTIWPSTLATTTATGTCQTGYYASSPPQRSCSQSGQSGNWSTPLSICSGIADFLLLFYFVILFSF